MALQEQLEAGLKKAMIDKNELELSVFRMVKAAIKNKEIALGHELSEEEIVGVLDSQAKQRRDAIAQYETGNREDLADREKRELAIIDSLLPAKMTEEEIRTVVKQKIDQYPEEHDFGKVMGIVMAELKGKADGGTVQKIVKEEIGE
jgi:uncharacterized protein YqeY